MADLIIAIVSICVAFSLYQIRLIVESVLKYKEKTTQQSKEV